MTKADIVNEIVTKTDIDKVVVLGVVESFMETIKNSMTNGENIYFRGFGSFILKKRAEKLGRNITKNTTVKIPAHNIPAFKPCKEFTQEVSAKVKVKWFTEIYWFENGFHFPKFHFHTEYVHFCPSQGL